MKDLLTPAAAKTPRSWRISGSPNLAAAVQVHIHSFPPPHARTNTDVVARPSSFIAALRLKREAAAPAGLRELHPIPFSRQSGALAQRREDRLALPHPVAVRGRGRLLREGAGLLE